MIASADHHDTRSGASARILVVDDDERNLLALSEVLEPIAEVVCSSSGREALRELLRGDFAVILLDVFMPDLDGYETAALIRSRDQTSRIPIIFLSAVNKETEHLMRGYEMGAVDYVFKPVDPTMLKSKVGVFVDLFKMRRQVEHQALAEQALREAHFKEQLSRIEVERQLVDSQRRQNSILKALPMAIYEAEYIEGAQLRRRFVGGDLAYFVGDQSEAALSGDFDWEAGIHPDDAAIVTNKLRDGDTVTLEYRWIGPDGSKRHLIDQRIETETSEGYRRWAGTVLDITERKQLEAQLVHAGKLDALGQLTGGVAHDFNNLLAAILGGLNILQRRLELGERERTVVDHMRHAAEQGTELVRRMMAFARQQDLSPSSFEPEGLCDSVAGLISHTLGGTIKVSWECPKSDLRFFVDRNQLELALMNLIINARDAMPEGGDIRVVVEEMTKAIAGQPAFRIRVQDSGCGIPEDALDKVTEPFFTTKETGKGTGLGLSMVAGFAEQSGGEFRIESTVGQGTTIELILPATAKSQPSPADSQEDNFDWLVNKRLMLIDDDETVRAVLTEQLRDAGGIVDDFPSGQEAIAALKTAPERFDFVLSDFAMPEMDGLQALDRITELAPNVRAVLMTGNADDSRLSNTPPYPIIRKPISMSAMASAFAAPSR